MPRVSGTELAWGTFCSFGVLTEKSLSIKRREDKSLPSEALAVLHLHDLYDFCR